MVAITALCNRAGKRRREQPGGGADGPSVLEQGLSGEAVAITALCNRAGKRRREQPGGGADGPSVLEQGL
ncbi:hypothetical protein, partial [Streptomyces violaceorubidus]